MDEICKQTIQMCINELDKHDNKKCIDELIITPFIKHITTELWPYIFASISFIFFLVIIIIILIFIILKISHSNKLSIY